MNATCLYLDWALTALFTAFALGAYCIPKTRYHPVVMLTLAFSFLGWPFQFFFLEYGVSALEATGHPETISLLIPVFACVAVAVLWFLYCFIDLVLILLMALIISQTQLIDVSIPVSLVIATAVWAIFSFSKWSNIKQGFAVSIYTSGMLTFGLGSMILETSSSAVNTLTPSCSNHFNEWLTCDVECSGILTYDNTGVRLLWGFCFVILFILRMVIQWIFTDSFYKRPKLAEGCCLVKFNADKWVDTDDRLVVPKRPKDGEHLVMLGYK